MKINFISIAAALSLGFIPLPSAAQYYTIPANQIDPATGNCYVVVRGGQESCAQYPGQAPMTSGVPITPLSPPPSSIPSNCANPAAAAQALQQENVDYAAANKSYEATEAANNAIDAKEAACVNSGKDGCGLAYNQPGGTAYTAYSNDGEAVDWACMSAAQQTAQANTKAKQQCTQYAPGHQGNGGGFFATGNGPFSGGNDSTPSLKYTSCLSKHAAAYTASQNANVQNAGSTPASSVAGSAAGASSAVSNGASSSVKETWGSGNPVASNAPVSAPVSAPASASASAAPAATAVPVHSNAVHAMAQSASAPAAGTQTSVPAAPSGGMDSCAQAAMMRSNPSLASGLSDDSASSIAFALAQLDAACRAEKK